MPKKTGKTGKTGKVSKRKPAAKEPVAQQRSGPRRVQLGQYKTLKLQKRIKHPVQLPNVWRLSRQAARTLWRHKRLFIGISLIYGILNVGLAQGLSGGTDLTSLKDTLNQAFTGHLGFLASGLGVFVAMVGTAGNTTDQTAGAYQIILAILVSLALIWTLRQVQAGHRPRIRDAYYQGMQPLIPFILILLVISLELIPMAIGSALYSMVVSDNIAVYTVEKIIWALLCILLAVWSIYMVSSSLFALYIVTLPDMTPMKALRSARGLVRFRRWTVLRKVLWLPLLLLIVALVVMLPIILWLTPLARWVFFVLTMLALAAIHAYLYTLYRELLNE